MKLIHTHFAIMLLTIALLPHTIHAQTSGSGTRDNTSETTGPRRFWQADLPGGSYMVALDRITSVSKHSYLIDGSISVTEVIIDTNGNSLARFYYLEPVGQDISNVGAGLSQRAKEILEQAGQRGGVDVNAVIKQYPTTTHAKTIEYRIQNTGDLDMLLSSVRSAWINGKGRKFTIKTGN